MNESNGDVVMMDMKNAIRTSRNEDFILEDVAKQEKLQTRLYSLIDHYEQKLLTPLEDDEKDSVEYYLEKAREDLEETTDRIQALNHELENPNFEEYD